MSSGLASQVLAGLKDFQRATVEYVFERLYAPGASGRFLVADEVGLGKTMIAKGVIARTIDHLREEQVKRIDVVYICSNGDIARQNINRLKVGEEEHIPLVSRLTLLPREIPKLKSAKSGVNFISFTPGTSFDVHAGLGQVHERVLLYCLLREAWGLGSAKPMMNVFQGHASADRFRWLIGRYEGERIDAGATQDFARALDAHMARAREAGKPDLRARLDALCTEFTRSDRNVSEATARERYRFVGDLRAVLAASCVNALEPDLIILDEFQRFSHLLDGDDDASRLARELFEYKDVRVLLLSATPYKMYTTTDEANGEDHYADFLRTLRFLERGVASESSLEETVAGYREALFAGAEPNAIARITDARKPLESRLRQVMVRTERLASTADRNGMLTEVPPRPMEVQPCDLHNYLAVQRVARDLKADDALELWKSSPFVLNFVDDGYKLGRKLSEALENGESRQRIARTLASTPTAMFPWGEAERYGAIDPSNARMRALLADVVDNEAYRMLWVPPSLPYYRLDGAFGAPGVSKFTKRLVFSSWRIVPRAIAAIISYQVERRMLAGDSEARNTPEARKRRRGLLRFAVADGRLTGMPVLALLYPSVYLARACDPAVLLSERARERSGDNVAASTETVSLEEVLAIAQARIEVGLRRIADGKADGSIDERWYWAAPLLLDGMLDPQGTRSWFEQKELAAAWSGADEEEQTEATEEPEQPNATRSEHEEADSWEKHVDLAREVVLRGAGSSIDGNPLGRMPDDLARVLAELAIAGPAVAMFRALDRVLGSQTGQNNQTAIVLRNGAGRTAWSFRSLFNQPEVVAMLRGGIRGATETPYWREVLRYCAEGCLAAVLDEYVHVLRDHLGLMGEGTVGNRVHEIADEIRDAVEVRTSRVRIEHLALSDSGRTLRAGSKNLRTHYALRFADESAEDGTVVTRADQIRKAFNSPFWPFVLATTSVGQEGLDFHTYCHAVVHWNLPSNPVDLEQREGRVHRYKGHAVRRNVARLHGWHALQSDERDVWESIFALALRSGREQGASEIVPFWVYPLEGGARIERHILALPLSREHAHAARLRSTLAIYRMVFGQPRQQDLIHYLVTRMRAEELESMMQEARIDLAPSVG